MKKFPFFQTIFLFLLIITLSSCISQKQETQQPTQLPKIEEKGGQMQLSSPIFQSNQSIPAKYTCDGEDINPPLEINNIPDATRTLCLIVDDPDAPGGDWVHWLVWNIDPAVTTVKENSIPQGGVQGTNDFKKLDYGGPCPPSGTHRYFFKLYALDTCLNLDSSTTKKDLEKAMEGHILEKSELIGLYKR